jgi:hypothetical protein
VQENHQLLGDPPGGLGAHIRLDQRERQVDPGGDPGRGDDRTVPDEDGVDGSDGCAQGIPADYEDSISLPVNPTFKTRLALLWNTRLTPTRR